MAALYFFLVVIFAKIGFRVGLAALTAYLLTFSIGYIAQKRFSFNSRSKHRESLPRYAVLQLLCAVSAMASANLAEVAGIQEPYMIGLITTLVLGIVSYFASSRWVFTK